MADEDWDGIEGVDGTDMDLATDPDGQMLERGESADQEHADRYGDTRRAARIDDASRRPLRNREEDDL